MRALLPHKHPSSAVCRTKEADSLRGESGSFISPFKRMMKWSRQVEEGGEGAQQRWSPAVSDMGTRCIMWIPPNCRRWDLQPHELLRTNVIVKTKGRGYMRGMWMIDRLIEEWTLRFVLHRHIHRTLKFATPIFPCTDGTCRHTLSSTLLQLPSSSPSLCSEMLPLTFNLWHWPWPSDSSGIFSRLVMGFETAWSDRSQSSFISQRF